MAEAPDRSDLTAVVVNYDSGDRVRKLIEALAAEVRRIIVVDNRSSDGSVDAIDEEPCVHVLRNDANRGFAAAANQGAAVATTGWVLFVNPDLNLQPGQVTALLRHVPADVGAVVPLQVDGGGRPRPDSAGHEPTLLRYLALAVLPASWRADRGPWLGQPYPSGDTTVEWGSGAMLAVRRHVFESLGGFDERYFFALEDVDLGRRIRASGYRSLLRPAVRVHHEVAQADSRRRVRTALLAQDSLALYFRGWRRRVLGLVMVGGSAVRALAGSPLQRAIGRASVARWLVVVLTGEPPGKR